MSENRCSLPPQITDDIQGTLVMVILKPALVPSLNPNQALEFRYSWWGSDFVHKIRLTSDLDELRVVYDVRSDIKGFQRYLADAEQLSVEIFVVSGEINAASSHLQVKCQSRRGLKEWKPGDYVGKFTLNNLKLNVRGEYISERNIINSYGNYLGSVIVFILFSSQVTSSFTKASDVQEEKLNELKVLEASDKTIQQCTISSSVDKNIPMEKIQLVTPTKYRKMPKENLSPRFIVFDNTTNVKKDKSPLKKCLKSPAKSKLEISNLASSNMHSTLGPDAKNSQICGGDNYILTKLFSFVDTGVIQPSDLPTLIQICQGRSPSIDFDLSEVQNRTLSSWNNSSILSNDNCDYQSDTVKLTLNEMSKYNKITFCDPPYCSNAYLKQMESAQMLNREYTGISLGTREKSNTVPSSSALPGFKNNKISNKTPPRCKDKIRLTPQRCKDKIRLTPQRCKAKIRLSDSTPPRLKDKKLTKTPSRHKIQDEGAMLDQIPSIKLFPEVRSINMEENFKINNIESPVTRAETSLLVLKFHGIHFRINLQNKDDNSVINQNKKIFVRQRSNVCYFVEVYLEFEEKHFNQSELYISRQITENQEIIFNTTRIFRLPTPENKKNEGFIKFKVSRRRLGNRLRESVGVGIVSINKLRSEDVGEINVTLPVWSSSDSSEKIKFNKNDNTEVPLGSFHFGVLFALSDTTSCIDNQPSELPEVGIGNSYPLNLRQNDYCDDNIPSTVIHYDNIPSRVIHDDNIPSTVIHDDNIPSTVIHDDNIPSTVIHYDNIPSTVIHDDNIPSTVIHDDNIPSTVIQDDNIPSTVIHDDNIPSTVIHYDNIPSTATNKYKDVLNETFTTESGMHFDENYADNQDSVIIENGSNVKYIPVRDAGNVSIKQEFHLEILEGNGFPQLRSKSLGQLFPPNAYVLASLSSDVHKTNIARCCTTPVWNYRTDFALYKEDLEITNFNIVLKVFHSLNGISAQPKDPLLGIAQIETLFLWRSFLSLCGWIPVITLNGELCGELKVSLTPKKLKPELRLDDNQINEDSRDNFPISYIESIQPLIDKTEKSESNKPFEKNFYPDQNGAEGLKDCRKQLFCEYVDEESYIGSPTPVCRSLINDQPPTVTAEKVEQDYAGKEHIGNDSLCKSTEIMNKEINAANVQTDICYTHVFKHEEKSDSNESRDLFLEKSILSPPDILIPVDTSKTPLKTHLVAEAMSWMNKGITDSPCVSYLDLVSKERDGEAQKFTKRKRRIAANLNFL